MFGSEMTRSKRFAAGIIILMMLSFLMLSSVFIAHEADHDCCGEDCPICEFIQQCENTVRGEFLFSSGISVIIPVLFVIFSVCLAADAFVKATPVSRKIRLNN